MNYNQMQRNASRLLRKYDQRRDVVLKLRANGAIDPLTGEYDEGTVVTQPITGVSSTYQKNQIDGEMVQYGDVHFLMTSDVRPSVGDYVVMDDIEWTVLEPIVEHNPGGTVLMYECNLRR